MPIRGLTQILICACLRTRPKGRPICANQRSRAPREKCDSIRTANRHRWTRRVSSGERANTRSGTRQNSGRNFGIRPASCASHKSADTRGFKATFGGIRGLTRIFISAPICEPARKGSPSALISVLARSARGRSERLQPTVYQKHRSLLKRTADV